MSNLTDFIKNKTQKITIMEGREKRDLKELLGKPVTINNYDFLVGNEGAYAVFTIKEDDKSFYFASSILTEDLMGIDHADLKKDVLTEGLKIELEERKSKNANRTYIAVNYVI